MDYNNNSLDPDLVEFCYSQRPKASQCHSHRTQDTPMHLLHVAHTQPSQSLADGCHRHPSVLPSTVAGSAKRDVSVATTYHHTSVHAYHQFPVQRLGPHGSRQHYRASLSPGQVNATNCGSDSTLSSSSGFCSASNSQTGVSASHCHQKPVNSPRAVDLIKLLREKIALLPGGRSRDGGPILCFPPNSKAGDIPFNELRLLVWYLTCLPEERVRKLGFTVIVDMRNGTTWQNVKPILKVIDCCLEKTISRAYIIKPDKIFEKHKALMAVGKFTFEIRIVSIDSLFREVDPSQLTADLEGSLPYNHEEWIKIRCSVEEFFLLAHDMSDQFCQLYKTLQCKYVSETVEEARRVLEEHRSIRLKIFQAPVSTLEAEAERLMMWLRYGISSAHPGGSAGTASATGGSVCPGASAAAAAASSCTAVTSTAGAGGCASFLATSWVSVNPDFQQLRPQVQQTIIKLYQFRTVLQQKWELGRSQLEQTYQLRIFDEDASRMANWLGHQRHMFLTEYWDIGENASHAADLHAEHRQFLSRCAAIREQITRLNGVATMLTDNGHFASQQILKKASQLEHDWKSFTAALEDRSRVLYLSATFNARAQSFIANCVHRETTMRQVNGSSLSELNQALDTLQTLWRESQSAHEEVCSDGRALADHLSAPVPTGSHTSLTAAVNYSQGRKHCTDLLHEIWSWFKQLERVFTERNRRLTSQLALLMFKEDVKQVLAWLSNHGEPFLQRQTAVGKSIQRAEQLYNSHMQFEQVAANTLTNAAKLISAADELAPQVDDADDVLQKANELQLRISAFTRAVETRRETLDVGCGFYSHTKEVLAWLHAAREENAAGASPTGSSQQQLPGSIEATEDALTQFHRNRQTVEAGVDRVITEGEALAGRLKESDEVAHLRAVMAQISTERSVVSGLFTERQVRLDLCLQLRLFEADVHSALDSLLQATRVLSRRPEASSGQRLANTGTVSSPRLIAETVGQAVVLLTDAKQQGGPEATVVEAVSNACVKALPTAEEVLSKGNELARAFSSVGVNFLAGTVGSSDSGVGESAETAVERVHRLITELNDAVSAVDELNERLVGELDWRRLQTQSREVLQWIDQFEEILRGASTIPTNLSQAELLQREHEQFQPVLNHAHPQAVQCAARATHLHQQQQVQLQHQQQTNGSGGPSEQHGLAQHPLHHQRDYQAVAEAVANRWQKLVFMAEERHKLLIAASSCYRTFDQVTTVLRSLEKEYHREEDWCQSEKAMAGGVDTADYLSELLHKHAEQKEAFLKACMLARRTSDLFTRYLQRQPPSTRGRSQVEEKIRQAISELMTKEQAVLEAWAVRRRRLDDCTCFVNIKRQIEDLLLRVYKTCLPSPSKAGGTGSTAGVKLTTAGASASGLSTSTQQSLNSSLLQEVNRACDSLDSMLSACIPLSPGHVSQLKALLARLLAVQHQACSQQQQQQQQRHKVSVDSLSSSGVAVSIHARHQQQQPTDTDRSSLSSTSTVGSGSTSTTETSNGTATTTTGLDSVGAAAAVGSGVTSSAVGLTPEQRRMQRRRENLLRELIQTERSYIQSLRQCLDTYYQCLKQPPTVLENLCPTNLNGRAETIFGNLPTILDYHERVFEPELGKYTESGDFLPEDVGHCFVIHSERLAELYVRYCVNNTEASQLLIEHGQTYFQAVQRHLHLMEPLQSFLIKPVQRVTKYQLLLRELRDCCEPASVAELSEGLEAMLNVPKRANDALHLSMLQNLPDDMPISSFGDVILQDQFTIWEPKQLIKKSRERRVFLFDSCLLMAKEVASAPGEHLARYQYKSRLLLAECNITEHIEGDQCKFALWTGRVPPLQEYRLVLKASSLELKQTWVRALREVQREHMFSTPSLFSTQQTAASDKSSFETATSTASADSTPETHYVLEDYQACGEDELSVSAHQAVQLLQRYDTPKRSDIASTATAAAGHTPAGDWALVRLTVLPTGLKTGPAPDGFIPARLLGTSVQSRRGAVTGQQSSSLSSGVWSNRRASASSSSSSMVRRLLPAPGTGANRRNAGVAVAGSTLATASGKRASKSDLAAQQMVTPTTVAPVGADLLVDNVSEESVDVELPPPMGELPALPTALVPVPATATASSTEGDEDGEGSPAADPVVRGVGSEQQQVEGCGACFSPPPVPTKTCEFRPVSLPEVVLTTATSTSTTGNNKNTTTTNNKEGDEDRTASVLTPLITDLPAGANLGHLRLHGALQVAARLVARPFSTRRQQENGGGAKTPVGEVEAGTTEEQQDLDEETGEAELLCGLLEEGVELHFVTRHLFLYDRALVVTDTAVQPVVDKDHRPADPPARPQCHFRQAIPVGQLSILEDVSLSDTKPTGEQLLWFCLSERARASLVDPNCGSLSPQSHLCYVVAPRCPDSRARWVTEVSAMVREARRLSHGVGGLLLSGCCCPASAVPSSVAMGDMPGGGGGGVRGADWHLLPSSAALLNSMSQAAAGGGCGSPSRYPTSGVLFDSGLLDLHKARQPLPTDSNNNPAV